MGSCGKSQFHIFFFHSSCFVCRPYLHPLICPCAFLHPPISPHLHAHMALLYPYQNKPPPPPHLSTHMHPYSVGNTSCSTWRNIQHGQATHSMCGQDTRCGQATHDVGGSAPWQDTLQHAIARQVGAQL